MFYHIHIRMRRPTAANRRVPWWPKLTGVLFALCAFSCLISQPSPAQSSSTNEQSYGVSGSVVNSATGEGIPRALVRTNGIVQRSTFTDSEGHFQIEGMPQTQVTVTAQKPGFFSESDEGGVGAAWTDVGPSTGPLVIKLIPQGAIYGRITDASAQPIEHLQLRLTMRSIRDGRRRLEPRGMTETDEDGHYRFAALMPGNYYLSVGPRQGESDLVVSGEKQQSGFPHMYYPGVPDLVSASPIQLTAGQQSEADMSVAAVPVYRVGGSIVGFQPEQGVGFQVLTAAGDDISVAVTFNSETGAFVLDNVPAGGYLLRAMAQSGLQPMRAEARISVNSNLENLRLALAPAVSIPISVRMDARSSSRSNASSGVAQRYPVSVHLISSDFTSNDAYSTNDASRNTPTLMNVEFGTYTVELNPQSPWYVQSANYGQTNVLYDDITVAPGQNYPLEIVLRDDSASISGAVKSPDAGNTRATIVFLPQPATKAAPRVLQNVTGNFDIAGLSPGDYLVFAFDRVDGLEYGNPDAVGGYASQAAHVTLTPNQKVQVSLDLIHVGKGG